MNDPPIIELDLADEARELDDADYDWLARLLCDLDEQEAEQTRS